MINKDTLIRGPAYMTDEGRPTPVQDILTRALVNLNILEDVDVEDPSSIVWMLVLADTSSILRMLRALCSDQLDAELEIDFTNEIRVLANRIVRMASNEDPFKLLSEEAPHIRGLASLVGRGHLTKAERMVLALDGA